MVSCIKKNKRQTHIIAPPLIGDCIMLLPLINSLKNIQEVIILSNEYTKDLFHSFKLNIRINNFQSVPDSHDFVCDFLGTATSAKYLQANRFDFTAGFPDNEYEYNYMLKLPYTFDNEPAFSIFTQILSLFSINDPMHPDFYTGFRWEKLNQKQILLAPGAGCLSRSWDVANFVKLAKNLQSNYGEVSFLLGPKEKSLHKEIPKGFKIIYTDNFRTTIEILRSSKFVISNEGGFMHFAAAFGIPLLGIFKVAKIKCWFPYINENQYAIGYGENNYEDHEKFTIPFDEVLVKSSEIYEKI